MQRFARVVTVAAAVAALAVASSTHAAPVHDQSAPTSPDVYTVTAGYGDDDYAANIFSPSHLEIYAGDTVTWKVGGKLEPHDVFFGPVTQAAHLAADLIVALPQQGGAPTMVLNPQLAFATPRRTYDGTGVAHSAFLALGSPAQSWTLTFTTPGTYPYWCLVHFDPTAPAKSMGGVVVVRPRPAAAKTYRITSGYDNGTQRDVADFFLPATLTIHAGDTVVWSPGFHTVAFGPEVTQLQGQLIVPKPQPHGPPLLTFNPQIFFPAGGTTYDGTGFVNSGLLIAPQPHPFSLTFTKPGTYKYVCLIHPGMDGTIVVLPAAL